jgi:hypothetical protein
MSTWNFILQIIPNVIVEYNYELNFECKLLHIPVPPLKFKIIDTEWQNNPVVLPASVMKDLENSMSSIRITCGKQR